MPHIVLNMKYPSHLASTVIKKSAEARTKKLLPDEDLTQEILVSSAAKFSEDGVKLLTVTRVKEGKLEEALMVIAKQMAYFSEIEGFESSVEVWATLSESYQMMGIKHT